ncbi:hypothetical protein BJV74DRAFT_857360 [Russula compacta]|nr:hypothetical protein BJV74DRAFT_857360 [Russula compacta]
MVTVKCTPNFPTYLRKAAGFHTGMLQGIHCTQVAAAPSPLQKSNKASLLRKSERRGMAHGGHLLSYWQEPSRYSRYGRELAECVGARVIMNEYSSTLALIYLPRLTLGTEKGCLNRRRPEGVKLRGATRGLVSLPPVSIRTVNTRAIGHGQGLAYAGRRLEVGGLVHVDCPAHDF